MADPTPTPAAPEPRDTHTIASEVLDSFTEPTPAPAPTPPADPTPAPNGNGAPSPQQVSEAEQLLRDAGYTTERKPDGRYHYIPRWKVVEMIESGLKTRGSAHEKAKTELQAQLDAAMAEAKQARQWREMMQGDPRALLARMAQLDPRFQAFLEPAKPEPPRLPKEEDDPEPGPDIDLGNGRATYSLQGLRRRDEWAQRRMERVIAERMRPYDDLKRQAEDRERKARQDQALAEHTGSQLQRAKAWPKWAEHEQAILKALQDDSAESERTGQPMKLANIYDAYMHVVGPVLATDEKTMRERLLKELNAAPRSTSVTQTGPEPTKAPTGRSTEEIARRALARLEGKP